MSERPAGTDPSAAEPLFETVWTNWPAVVLFAAGVASAGYWSVQPGTRGTFPFGFPWVLLVELVWILLALLNARLRLAIHADRMVLRPLWGPARELARAEWGCLLVMDPPAIPWWQRWWSGSGTRSMLGAQRGSPCRCLFVPAALTGIPLPRGSENRVSELLAPGPAAS